MLNRLKRNAHSLFIRGGITVTPPPILPASSCESQKTNPLPGIEVDRDKIKDLLHALLKNEGAPLTEEINSVLNDASPEFSDEFFDVILDIRKKNQGQLTNRTLLWLFSLPAIQQLEFIRFKAESPDIPTTSTLKRLQKIFENEDLYFIDVICSADRSNTVDNFNQHKFFVAMIHIDNYRTKPMAYGLSQLLMRNYFYQNIQNYYPSAGPAFKNSSKVKSVLQLRHFFSLNTQLRELTQDITNISVPHNNNNVFSENDDHVGDTRGAKYDLDYFNLSPKKKHAHGINYDFDYFDDLFFHHLLNEHQEDIMRLSSTLLHLPHISTKNPLLDGGKSLKENSIYLKAKALYERIACASPERHKELYTCIPFVTFSIVQILLAYIIELLNPNDAAKSTLIDQVESDFIAQKRALKKNLALEEHGGLTIKEQKVPFLRWVAHYLIDNQEYFKQKKPVSLFEQLHTLFKPKEVAAVDSVSEKTVITTQPPLIWEVYLDACFLLRHKLKDKSCLSQEELTYSPKRMPAVNKWLKKVIFHGTETQHALARLPNYVLEHIFAGTALNVGALKTGDEVNYFSIESISAQNPMIKFNL